MLWSTDTCQNNVSAAHYHVSISRAQVFNSSRSLVFLKLTKCWFSIGSRAHARLTCWKQGRIVWKAVYSSQELMIFSNHIFLLYKCFLLPCFVYMVIIKLKAEGQTRNRKPHHKTQRKILPLPWLAKSGTEQPGQGATLLGWPKSIYYMKWLKLKIPSKKSDGSKPRIDSYVMSTRRKHNNVPYTEVRQNNVRWHVAFFIIVIGLSRVQFGLYSCECEAIC